MRRSIKIRTLYALVVLVSSLALLSCEKRNEETVTEEAKINVRAESPVIKDMYEVVEVHGNLEPQKQAEVVSEVSGTVMGLYAEEGDKVKRGDVLAKIDDEEYLLNLRQAESAFNVAESDYESTKELFEQGMKSKSELEKMERTYIDAKTNLQMNRIRLKNTEVKTPIGGTVVKRNVDLYRQINAMEPLFRVADLDGFLINITVTEAEVARIRLGQNVKVRIDAVVDDPNSFPFEGTVSKIQPMVDPQTGTVEVEVTLPHPGLGVRPGMFARLKIVTGLHEDTLAIPRRALSSEDEKHVWVVDGDRARMVEIETGLTDAKTIEITSGLSPDDLVIIEGQGALTPKSKINIVNQEEDGSSKLASESDNIQ